MKLNTCINHKNIMNDKANSRGCVTQLRDALDMAGHRRRTDFNAFFAGEFSLTLIKQALQQHNGESCRPRRWLWKIHWKGLLPG